MFENFPYTDMHQLNLDWIVKIAKDFLEQYTTIQQTIEDGRQGIIDLTSEELEALQTQANEIETLLNNWYTTHQNYLDETLATNLNIFNQQATAKGEEVIESIPSDYTTLSNDVSVLKHDDSVYMQTGLHETLLSWEYGTFNTNNGNPVSTNASLRTVSFIPFTRDISIQAPAGYLFSIHYYDANGTWLMCEYNKRELFNILYDPSSPKRKIKLTIKKTDGTDMDIYNPPDLHAYDMPYNTSNILTFDTVDDMIQFKFTPYHAILKTKGFYEPGDGGAATYQVINDDGPASIRAPHVYVKLNNGMVARLVHDKTLFAKQIGCKANDNTFDNSEPVNEITTHDEFKDCVLVFNRGTYYFANGILDTKNVNLVGESVLDFYSYDNVSDPRLVFTSVNDSTNYAAIYCNSHSNIANLFICGTFVTYTEDKSLIGSTSQIQENWLTFSRSMDNTVGIRIAGAYSTNYNCTIQNCVIRGFSTGIMMATWSIVTNCLVCVCDTQCITMQNDCQVCNCRLQYSANGIISANLAIIHNIRMDSIKYVGIECNGTNAEISDIVGDYVGQCLIESVNKNGLIAANIAGRCGVNYVNVNYSGMTEEHKKKCSVINIENCKNINISSMNGSIRILDDDTQLVNTRAVSLNNVQSFVIAFMNDQTNDFTANSIRDILFIGSLNSCTGSLLVNQTLYKLFNTTNTYSAIKKAVYENI